MLLKCKTDVTLADGTTYRAGDVIDTTLAKARMLLQKHSAKLEAIYQDKAKHAPTVDKFSRKMTSTQTK